MAWEEGGFCVQEGISCMGDRDFGDLFLKHCGGPEKLPQPKDDLKRCHKTQTKPLFPLWSLVLLSLAPPPASGPMHCCLAPVPHPQPCLSRKEAAGRGLCP